MKLKKLIALIMCVLSFFLISCGGVGDDYRGKVKVVFSLEGGQYKNSDRPIVFYYGFKDGTTNLIKEPTALSKQEILRSGYHIDGWYKTKTVNGENVEYAEKWDFEKDEVGKEGITLYLKWVRDVIYTYDLCYRDEESGKEVVLHSYEVVEGEQFEDYLDKAKRFGYTPIGFETEDGKPWDENFTHPGGETSNSVKVYVKYIKGTFEIVSTPKELKRAKSKNIFLMNDIDMKGESFSFNDYKKNIEGNGFAIKNFNLAYDGTVGGLKEDPDGEVGLATVQISLFGNTKDAIINNVRFEDVVVDVDIILTKVKKIFISPFAIKMENTTMNNVSFSGTYVITKLPNGFHNESMIIITDRAYYSKDEKSTFTNVTVNFAQKA